MPENRVFREYYVRNTGPSSHGMHEWKKCEMVYMYQFNTKAAKFPGREYRPDNSVQSGSVEITVADTVCIEIFRHRSPIRVDKSNHGVVFKGVEM